MGRACHSISRRGDSAEKEVRATSALRNPNLSSMWDRDGGRRARHGGSQGGPREGEKAPTQKCRRALAQVVRFFRLGDYV